MSSLVRANIAALAIPGLLMAGALGSQVIGGLYPCEMCHWQRWPHYAAIALALLAFVVKPPARNVMVALAALAILTSGAIGVFHAGVEYHWWAGPPCSATSGAITMKDLWKVPIIRCDQPQWSIFGISLAGFNALFSILGGIAILGVVRKAK